MSEVFDVQLINTALRQATPLILAALGGLMSERTGVINSGLEGKILMGALSGAYGALLTGSPWGGRAVPGRRGRSSGKAFGRSWPLRRPAGGSSRMPSRPWIS